MASAPDTHNVTVHVEFDDESKEQIKQLIRDEVAMFAAGALTAAVDRRDGSGPWHSAHRSGGQPDVRMSIGVLAGSKERARHIIRTDPILAGKLSAEVEPLSVRGGGHRGRTFEAIIVDSDLWPLSEQLNAEYAPCLIGSGGSFYVRSAS